LTPDFIFMPEQWGVGVVHDADVILANQQGFPDKSGGLSHAQMANIFMGSNEPDNIGFCEGTEGYCSAPCSDDEVQAGECPIAKDGMTKPYANAAGHCDCWSSSSATSAGYWSFGSCYNPQPLPSLWKDFTAPDRACQKQVMDAWKVTADVVHKKGYKFLTTPLVAGDMDWLRHFVNASCAECHDVSCGCPSHVAWHFYATDCRPIELGGYDDFKHKLEVTKELMRDFPFLKGAIVNEIGMLNCVFDDDGMCIANGPNQKYPAKNYPDHSCPSTDELPNGMGSFLEQIVTLASGAKTDDGRSVVKGFSWFNQNQVGATYDLRLLNDDGSINGLGQSYMTACQNWGAMKEEVMV